MLGLIKLPVWRKIYIDMKLKKGDKVKILSGKDKGREGVVERVYPKQKKVLMMEVNIYKKHIPKSEKKPEGGVLELPRPIDVSNVMLICPKCGKTTRVGYQLNENKKERICKKCSKII